MKVQKVLALAEGELGYLEKKSSAQLDSKTANAGSKNYTKYNRDYVAWGAGGAQPMQWCGAFVSWLFAKAYGLEQAKKLLCGGLFHYTPTGASRFQKKGQYIARSAGRPAPGDVVFFYSKAKGRIGHTGIVYRVDGGKVYTIEGNTSGANTLVTNGGGVKKKSYKLTDACIHGYGRPAYEDTQEELNLRVLKNGSRGADVKALQILLMGYGEDCGACGADGVFGSATGKAVKAYQSKNGLAADSIAGEKTWRKLLGVTA